MPKRRLNCVPDVGAQAVAAGEPEPVLALLRMRRRVDAGSGTARRYTGTACSPSARCRPRIRARRTCSRITTEPPLTSTRAGRHHAADGVIHRQAVVHAVAGAGVHHAGEPVARQHQPIMVDVGRLGQAGRARGVDVERAVLDGEPAALGVRQRVARQGVDFAIDARQVGVGLAVQPELGDRSVMCARAVSNCASSASAATMMCAGARR